MMINKSVAKYHLFQSMIVIEMTLIKLGMIKISNLLVKLCPQINICNG